MQLVSCGEDKRNLSTADRSHQLALDLPLLDTLPMAAIFQQLIICAPVFSEDDHHLIIELTTGWLLGTIHCWDGREHTPSSGFGHYLLTYKVLSVVVVLDRTLMERL